MDSSAICAQQQIINCSLESRRTPAAVRLYFNLPKASLTNTLFTDEPDVED